MSTRLATLTGLARFLQRKNRQTLRLTGWWLRWIGSSCGARNALCAPLTAFRPLRHPLAPFIRHWRRGQGGANDIRIMSATRDAHRAPAFYTFQERKPAGRLTWVMSPTSYQTAPSRGIFKCLIIVPQCFHCVKGFYYYFLLFHNKKLLCRQIRAIRPPCLTHKK